MLLFITGCRLASTNLGSGVSNLLLYVVAKPLRASYAITLLTMVRGVPYALVCDVLSRPGFTKADLWWICFWSSQGFLGLVFGVFGLEIF